MSLIFNLICAGSVFAAAVKAQSLVTITVPLKAASGMAIPDDFIGLSFETAHLLPEKGTHFFSAENKQAITLFCNMGIHSLRVGGATADMARYPEPGTADIDALFAFAQATDVRVIYTSRLLNGNVSNAVAMARYIAEHYPTRLDCFALGNEPDWSSYHKTDPASKDYPSFLADWRKFAQTIRERVPIARFEGP